MAKRTFLAGATSQTMDIFIQDSSSTTGAGLSGLAFNTSGLKAYYRKGATGSATAITLATQTVGGAWSSGGFVEIDATNMKGVYRFDIVDTILAATPWATIYFYGATNMAPVVAEVEIVSYNPFDSVRLGLTALPNAAAGANGGLPLGDASGRVDIGKLLGTAWLTPGTAGTPDVNVKLWNALATVALPLVPTTAGRTLDVSAGGEAGVDWANVGSPTTAVDLSGTTIKTTQKVDVDTIKTNPVVNGGTITFPANATLASTTNITAGTITTTTNATNISAGGITASSFAANAIDAVALATTATDEIRDALFSTAATKLTVDANGRVDVSKVGGDTATVTNMVRTFRSLIIDTMTSGSTTTSVKPANLVGTVADQYKGRIITFRDDTTTAALRGQQTDITASSLATPTVLTVTALTTAPASGDTFTIN